MVFKPLSENGDFQTLNATVVGITFVVLVGLYLASYGSVFKEFLVHFDGFFHHSPTKRVTHNLWIFYVHIKACLLEKCTRMGVGEEQEIHSISFVKDITEDF
jgi:hypothetical protein